MFRVLFLVLGKDLRYYCKGSPVIRDSEVQRFGFAAACLHVETACRDDQISNSSGMKATVNYKIAW